MSNDDSTKLAALIERQDRRIALADQIKADLDAMLAAREAEIDTLAAKIEAEYTEYPKLRVVA